MVGEGGVPQGLHSPVPQVAQTYQALFEDLSHFFGNLPNLSALVEIGGSAQDFVDFICRQGLPILTESEAIEGFHLFGLPADSLLYQFRNCLGVVGSQEENIPKLF